MTVPLVNPSDLSFTVGVITPRWLFVLASAWEFESPLPHLWGIGCLSEIQTAAQLEQTAVQNPQGA